MQPSRRLESQEETKPRGISEAQAGGGAFTKAAKSHTKPRSSDGDDDDEIILLSPSASYSPKTSRLFKPSKQPGSPGPNEEGYRCPDHAQCEKKYTFRDAKGKQRTRREGDKRWKGTDMCTTCKERGAGECIGTGCFRCNWCADKKKKCSHSEVAARISKAGGTANEAQAMDKKRKRSASTDDEGEGEGPRTRRHPTRRNDEREKGKQKARKGAVESSDSESDTDGSENGAESSDDDEDIVEKIVKRWNEMAGRYDKVGKAKKQASIAKAKKAVENHGIIDLQKMIQIESQSQKVLSELMKRSNEMVLAASSRLDKLM